MSPIHVTSAVIGGAVAIIFATADLWFFHGLAKDTDLTLFLAGLAAYGVTGAYSAGLHSDPVPTPPQPPAPPVPPTI